MITAILGGIADTATPASGNSELIVAVLGAGSFGAILAAVITGIFSKKKLGAEAAEIITKAASGVVENLNAEITRVNGQMILVRQEAAEAQVRHAADIAKQRIEHDAEMARQQTRHDAQIENIRRVLQLHVSWDMMAKAKLAEHGIKLPEPPPLLPPLRDPRDEWLPGAPLGDVEG